MYEHCLLVGRRCMCEHCLLVGLRCISLVALSVDEPMAPQLLSQALLHLHRT